MAKDNLKIRENEPKRFDDIKYGFAYIHDVSSDFESEYENIRQKYVRRVKVFYETIIHPTLFFRGLRNQEEINYINENWEYAENLLKKYNKENHIIYLLPANLGNLTDRVQAYRLRKYDGSMYGMRHWFDSSEEMMTLCQNLISTEQMKKNKEFDRMHNGQRAMADEVHHCVKEDIDGIDELILAALNGAPSERIYLWGAGKYGIPLAKYLRARNVVINGIIDNQCIDEVKEGFNIIPFEKVNDGVKIFVAVADKEANEAIVKQIMGRHTQTKIARYQDLDVKLENA